ncbi:hypothetical protein CTAYLR_007652 [Chrysophaeum taylorii]|uniref:PI3K/PI4K catalytic domain-containing protein n=1 Tax=Chrysophaeum taylorii TaxID=2483200 RepID=A0AAD7XHK4_9STRA|nr:hypothetical protein CTAYLR_007652 [Chrysophaeum taylorii]
MPSSSSSSYTSLLEALHLPLEGEDEVRSLAAWPVEPEQVVARLREAVMVDLESGRGVAERRLALYRRERPGDLLEWVRIAANYPFLDGARRRVLLLVAEHAKREGAGVFARRARELAYELCQNESAEKVRGAACALLRSLVKKERDGIWAREAGEKLKRVLGAGQTSSGRKVGVEARAECIKLQATLVELYVDSDDAEDEMVMKWTEPGDDLMSLVVHVLKGDDVQKEKDVKAACLVAFERLSRTRSYADEVRRIAPRVAAKIIAVLRAYVEGNFSTYELPGKALRCLSKAAGVLAAEAALELGGSSNNRRPRALPIFELLARVAVWRPGGNDEPHEKIRKHAPAAVEACVASLRGAETASLASALEARLYRARESASREAAIALNAVAAARFSELWDACVRVLRRCDALDDKAERRGDAPRASRLEVRAAALRAASRLATGNAARLAATAPSARRCARLYAAQVAVATLGRRASAQVAAAFSEFLECCDATPGGPAASLGLWRAAVVSAALRHGGTLRTNPETSELDDRVCFVTARLWRDVCGRAPRAYDALVAAVESILAALDLEYLDSPRNPWDHEILVNVASFVGGLEPRGASFWGSPRSAASCRRLVASSRKWVRVSALYRLAAIAARHAVDAEVLGPYLVEVSAATPGFRGDPELLEAACSLVLNAPEPLRGKNLAAFAPCVRAALGAPRTAKLAMDALEAWRDEPALSSLLPAVLPELGAYARVSAAAADDDDDDQDMLLAWKKKKKKNGPVEDATAIATGARELARRALRLLGSLGAANAGALGDREAALAASLAWSSRGAIEVELLDDASVLRLDAAMPRIAEIAASPTTPRHARVLACEAFHACLLVAVGTEATTALVQGAGLDSAFERAFPVVLSLAADDDPLVRRLFGVADGLLAQLARWLAGRDDSARGRTLGRLLLDAARSALVDEDAPARRRDVAASTLAEFLKYVVKGLSSSSSSDVVGGLFSRLVSDLSHKNSANRRGGATALRRLLRYLRSEVPLVSRFGLALLRAALRAVRRPASRVDEEAARAASEAVERLADVVCHHVRDRGDQARLLVAADDARLAPRNVAALLDWLWGAVADLDPVYRRRAWRTIATLADLEPFGGLRAYAARKLRVDDGWRVFEPQSLDDPDALAASLHAYATFVDEGFVDATIALRAAEKTFCLAALRDLLLTTTTTREEVNEVLRRGADFGAALLARITHRDAALSEVFWAAPGAWVRALFRPSLSYDDDARAISRLVAFAPRLDAPGRTLAGALLTLPVPAAFRLFPKDTDVAAPRDAAALDATARLYRALADAKQIPDKTALAREVARAALATPHLLFPCLDIALDVLGLSASDLVETLLEDPDRASLAYDVLAPRVDKALAAAWTEVAPALANSSAKALASRLARGALLADRGLPLVFFGDDLALVEAAAPQNNTPSAGNALACVVAALRGDDHDLAERATRLLARFCATDRRLDLFFRDDAGGNGGASSSPAVAALAARHRRVFPLDHAEFADDPARQYRYDAQLSALCEAYGDSAAPELLDQLVRQLNQLPSHQRCEWLRRSLRRAARRATPFLVLDALRRIFGGGGAAWTPPEEIEVVSLGGGPRVPPLKPAAKRALIDDFLLTALSSLTAIQTTLVCATTVGGENDENKTVFFWAAVAAISTTTTTTTSDNFQTRAAAAVLEAAFDRIGGLASGDETPEAVRLLGGMSPKKLRNTLLKACLKDRLAVTEARLATDFVPSPDDRAALCSVLRLCASLGVKSQTGPALVKTCLCPDYPWALRTCWGSRVDLREGDDEEYALPRRLDDATTSTSSSSSSRDDDDDDQQQQIAAPRGPETTGLGAAARRALAASSLGAATAYDDWSSRDDDDDDDDDEHPKGVVNRHPCMTATVAGVRKLISSSSSWTEEVLAAHLATAAVAADPASNAPTIARRLARNATTFALQVVVNAYENTAACAAGSRRLQDAVVSAAAALGEPAKKKKKKEGIDFLIRDVVSLVADKWKREPGGAREAYRNLAARLIAGSAADDDHDVVRSFVAAFAEDTLVPEDATAAWLEIPLCEQLATREKSRRRHGLALTRTVLRAAGGRAGVVAEHDELANAVLAAAVDLDAPKAVFELAGEVVEDFLGVLDATTTTTTTRTTFLNFVEAAKRALRGLGTSSPKRLARFASLLRLATRGAPRDLPDRTLHLNLGLAAVRDRGVDSLARAWVIEAIAFADPNAFDAEELFDKLVDAELLALFAGDATRETRDAAPVVQLALLRLLISKSRDLARHRAAARLVDLLPLFAESRDLEVRRLAYDLLRRLHDAYFPAATGEMAERVKGGPTPDHEIRRALLRGLADPDVAGMDDDDDNNDLVVAAVGARRAVYDYWRKRFPPERGLDAVLREVFCCAEARPHRFATSLLLLRAATAASKKPLFKHPLSATMRADAPRIALDDRPASLAPSFSLDAQLGAAVERLADPNVDDSIRESARKSLDDIIAPLRATQTQQKRDATRLATQTADAPGRQLFLASQHIFKPKKKNTTSRDDDDDDNDDVVVGRRRVRFQDDDHQQQQQQPEKKKRRVVLRRAYKAHELPDIQISLEDVVRPLAGLALCDAEVSAVLFEQLFAAAASPELFSAVADALRDPDASRSPELVEALLRACARSTNTSVPAAVVAESAARSGAVEAAAVFIEAEKNPDRAQLRRLYAAYGDEDAELAACEDTPALAAEARGDPDAALDLYAREQEEQEERGFSSSRRVRLALALGDWETAIDACGAPEDLFWGRTTDDDDESFFDNNNNNNNETLRASVVATAHAAKASDAAAVERCARMVRRVRADPRALRWARAQAPAALAVAFVAANDDIAEARAAVDAAYERAAAEWAALDPCAFAGRAEALREAVRAAEVDAYLEERLGGKEDRPRSLARRWDAMPLGAADPSVHWMRSRRARRVCAQRLLFEGAEDLKAHTRRLASDVAEMALARGDVAVARRVAPPELAPRVGLATARRLAATGEDPRACRAYFLETAAAAAAAAELRTTARAEFVAAVRAGAALAPDDDDDASLRVLERSAAADLVASGSHVAVAELARRAVGLDDILEGNAVACAVKHYALAANDDDRALPRLVTLLMTENAAAKSAWAAHEYLIGIEALVPWAWRLVEISAEAAVVAPTVERLANAKPAAVRDAARFVPLLSERARASCRDDAAEAMVVALEGFGDPEHRAARGFWDITRGDETAWPRLRDFVFSTTWPRGVGTAVGSRNRDFAIEWTRVFRRRREENKDDCEFCGAFANEEAWRSGPSPDLAAALARFFEVEARNAIGPSDPSLESISSYLRNYDGDLLSVPGPSGVAISSFDPAVEAILDSKRRPKKLAMRCADGLDRRFLVKFGEDLRNDERIQRLFQAMRSRSKKKKKMMMIRCYGVVPLTPRVGIIEWIDHALTLERVLAPDPDVLQRAAAARDEIFGISSLRDYHKPGSAARAFEAAREVVMESSSSSKDVLRRFFLSLAPRPAAFVASRANYASSLAAASACGYLVGLGDRHLDNILLDVRDASVVHVDLAVSFGLGVSGLPVPELLPFRLTPELLSPFFDGPRLFQRHLATALSALRAPDAAPALLALLDAFARDPVLDWHLHATRQQQQQQQTGYSKKKNAQSPRDRVDIATGKLRGSHPTALLLKDLEANPDVRDLGTFPNFEAALEPHFPLDSDAPLDPHAQARALISIATDPAILGRQYVGLNPWC